MLALLGLSATLTGCCASPVIVVVVIVVRLQDALPQLFLPSVDIRVQLVAVLANRELRIVINGDVDAARAHRLVFRVVELGYVGVLKGLLRR